MPAAFSLMPSTSAVSRGLTRMRELADEWNDTAAVSGQEERS